MKWNRDKETVFGWSGKLLFDIKVCVFVCDVVRIYTRRLMCLSFHYYQAAVHYLNREDHSPPPSHPLTIRIHDR